MKLVLFCFPEHKWPCCPCRGEENPSNRGRFIISSGIIILLQYNLKLRLVFSGCAFFFHWNTFFFPIETLFLKDGYCKGELSFHVPVLWQVWKDENNDNIIDSHEIEILYSSMKSHQRKHFFSSSFKIIRWLKACSNNNNFSSLWGEKSNQAKISLKLTDHGMNLIPV